MTWLIKIEVDDADARDEVALLIEKHPPLGIIHQEDDIDLKFNKIIDIEFEELEEDDL
tara:strand:+ start:352 stop:525 length:174 start_codon:yes stop_codon:yes gene_type:complete